MRLVGLAIALSALLETCGENHVLCCTFLPLPLSLSLTLSFPLHFPGFPGIPDSQPPRAFFAGSRGMEPRENEQSPDQKLMIDAPLQMRRSCDTRALPRGTKAISSQDSRRIQA